MMVDLTKKDILTLIADEAEQVRKNAVWCNNPMTHSDGASRYLEQSTNRLKELVDHYMRMA